MYFYFIFFPFIRLLYRSNMTFILVAKSIVCIQTLAVSLHCLNKQPFKYNYKMYLSRVLSLSLYIMSLNVFKLHTFEFEMNALDKTK